MHCYHVHEFWMSDHMYMSGGTARLSDALNAARRDLGVLGDLEDVKVGWCSEDIQIECTIAEGAGTGEIPALCSLDHNPITQSLLLSSFSTSTVGWVNVLCNV